MQLIDVKKRPFTNTTYHYPCEGALLSSLVLPGLWSLVEYSCIFNKSLIAELPSRYTEFQIFGSSESSATSTEAIR